MPFVDVAGPEGLTRRMAVMAAQRRYQRVKTPYTPNSEDLIWRAGEVCPGRWIVVALDGSEEAAHGCVHIRNGRVALVDVIAWPK